MNEMRIIIYFQIIMKFAAVALFNLLRKYMKYAYIFKYLQIKQNFCVLHLSCFIGLAYDLKTVSVEMIRKRVARTGDGSHPYNKEKELIEKDDDDHYHPENPIWGWDDQDMTEEEKKLAEIVHKID